MANYSKSQVSPHSLKMARSIVQDIILRSGLAESFPPNLRAGQE